MGRPPKPPQTYIADCLDCGHHWVSRAGFGVPGQCPKCRSEKITSRPTGS